MKNKHTYTLCKCCGLPILDRTAQARYHIDREPCYAAQQKHMRDQERKCREHQKDERRKPTSACQAKKRHRKTPDDLMEMYGHLDGDWIYC